MQFTEGVFQKSQFVTSAVMERKYEYSNFSIKRNTNNLYSYKIV
jgi:hypothetical protein